MQRIALAVRTSIRLGDPMMRGTTPTFDNKQRDRLSERLQPLAIQSPELDSFVSDCLACVNSSSETLALYLHLVHVARMLELLSSALTVKSPSSAKKTLKQAITPAQNQPCEKENHQSRARQKEEELRCKEDDCKKDGHIQKVDGS
ncbi:MAG: hypothetical protein R3C68_09520 [Myxococcota bacterium]